MTLLWILAAAILGFGVAAIFAGLFRLKRDVYLLIYIPLTSGLIVWFITDNAIDIRNVLIRNWYWGLTGAVIAGVFVIRNVFSQPSSARSRGAALVADIFWPGLIYGFADAMILSVLPVLSVRLAFSGFFHDEFWYEKIAIGILALVASSLVTTAYHLGYPEFRGKQVIWPNVGNGVLTIAYILTLNTLAAILPHMAMHVAAMIHGKDTTGQVPPHYKDTGIN